MIATINNSKVKLLILWFVFYCFYLCGVLFPEYWWSTHFIAYLPPLWKYILLIIAGLLPFLVFVDISKLTNQVADSSSGNRYKHLFIAGTSIFMAFLFYKFPIVHDFYGEASKLTEFLYENPTAIPEQANEEFFRFGLNPWAGQQTVLSIVTYIAYFFQITYKQAFYLLDTVCGFLFVITWIYFVDRSFKEWFWKTILILMGISAPFMLNFYGHIEVNAPVLLGNLIWMILLVSYFNKRKIRYLWLLIGFLPIFLKLHPVALLFVPALVLVLADRFLPLLNKSDKIINWRNGLYFVFIPIFVAGAILYFFVFEDYKDPRDLHFTAMEFDRLFLPLISPEAPLDKYNLLSFNHIFDYFSEMLLWSPIAIFILVYVLLFQRKNILWSSPIIVLTGITLILFGSLFFVVNPLLSMQMDWDLFSFPAPILLVFIVVILSKLKEKQNPVRLMPVALSLAMLSLPIFVVNASTIPLSYHLQSSGIRVYHTYYEWAANIMQKSWGITDEKHEVLIKRIDDVIEELRPFSLPGKDYEYGTMLNSQGQLKLIVGDIEEAIQILERQVSLAAS